jgi:hypothetical protein
MESVITSAGELTQPRILLGVVGHDAEPLATVQTWRFSPALLCGKPLDSIYSVSVDLYVDAPSYIGRRSE